MQERRAGSKKETPNKFIPGMCLTPEGDPKTRAMMKGNVRLQTRGDGPSLQGK